MPEKVKILYKIKIGTHMDPVVRSLCGKTVKVVGSVRTPIGVAYRVRWKGVEIQILARHTEPISLS